MKFLWSVSDIFKDRSEKKIMADIRSCPLFEELNPKELHILRGLIHIRKYNVGEYVFQRNQAGTGVYILSSGKVAVEVEKVFIDKKSGEEKHELSLIETLEEGDFFGEQALADGEDVRSASVKVIEPSTLLAFFKPDLIGIVKNRPVMGSKILMNLSKILSERLKRAAKDAF